MCGMNETLEDRLQLERLALKQKQTQPSVDNCPGDLRTPIVAALDFQADPSGLL